MNKETFENSKQGLPQLETKEFNDLASAYFGGKPKQESTLEQIDQTNPVTKGSTALVYKRNNMDNITLEEANWKVIGTKDDTFYNGAKWQQERMYSEEEVYDLFAQWIAYQQGFPRIDEDEIPNSFRSFNEWFEQFKKK